MTPGRLPFFWFFALVLGVWPLQAQKPAPVPEKDRAAHEAETAGLTKIAQAWLDLANAAIEKSAAAASKTLLARAKAVIDQAPKASAEPVLKRHAALEKKLAALKPAADEKAIDLKVNEASKKIAESYDKLAQIECAPADEERFEKHLFTAFEIGGKSADRAALMRKLAARAKEKSRLDRVARLYARAGELDPEGFASGAWRAFEDAVARKDCLMIGAPDHPMKAWLALPEQWDEKKTWPVIVAVEGAGCGFQGACRNFRGEAQKLGYIVVTPIGLSNTNALEASKYPYPQAMLDEWNEKRFEFDSQGLRAVLAVVHARFKGEERFAMTGFSGGGMLTYWWLLRRSSDLWAAAPACGNFNNDLRDVVSAVNGGPPVHLFTGEKDEHNEKVLGKYTPGILGQTDLAEAALKEHGFANVKRSLLPGVPHAPCAKEVVAFFESVRPR